MDNTRKAKARFPFRDKLDKRDLIDRLEQAHLYIAAAQLAVSMTGEQDSKLLDWAHNDIANANRRICSELERLRGEW